MSTRTHAPVAVYGLSASRSPLLSPLAISASAFVRNEGTEYELPINMYTLKDLYGRPSPREKENDKIGKEWINKLLMESSLNDFETLNASAQLPLYSNLMPFYSTDVIKPNVTVVTIRDTVMIPVVTVEVFSDTWNRTRNRTLINVVNQLRILRAFNPSTEECVGYAFPGFNQHQSAAVVQLTVRFKDMKFQYKEENLEQRDVKGKIRQHLVNFTRWSSSNPNFSYFIRLSPEECRELGEDVVQISSQSSYLFHSPSQAKYFKRSTAVTHQFSALAAVSMDCFEYTNQVVLKHSLLPEKSIKLFGNMLFYQYVELDQPISRDQAKQELVSLLKGVHAALHELHSTKEIAHLDVRLDNICFTRSTQKQVQLIDLDRCEPSKDDVITSLYKPSDMYRPKPGWKNYQLDWKCVGLLICFVLDRNVRPEDYHQMISDQITTVHLQHSFVNSLISDGKWDDNAFRGFSNEYHPSP